MNISTSINMYKLFRTVVELLVSYRAPVSADNVTLVYCVSCHFITVQINK